MKKLLIIIMVLGIGAGVFYMMRMNGAEQTAQETATPSEEKKDEETKVSLQANGLGVADFGAAPEQAIAQLTSALGALSKDTGLIDSFSPYGTCPGEKIRVVEWNRLRIFFGDTAFGTQKFFQYTYSDRDTVVPRPALATAEGLTLGSEASIVQSLYPKVTIEPHVEENYDWLDLVPADTSTHAYLGAGLQDGKIFWLTGGIPCGE